MELNKNLEWRITFKKVQNLDGIKKSENYVNFIKIDENIYTITVEGTKRISERFLNGCMSEFKKAYNKGRIKEGAVFEQTIQYQSSLSEN